MTSVCSDDAVVLINRALHAHGDSFLTDGKVTEPTDELGLVQSIGGHLHAAHCGHLTVHVD